MKHYIQSRIKSFQYAFEGFKPVLKGQKNMHIHILAAVVVVCAGLYFDITLAEWLAITCVIGFVWVCEFFNSAIETLANVVSPDFNKHIKQVKDISAAAVLISAITAVIVGVIVFWKYLFV